MKIVNWQTLFTDHQLYTWQAFQNLLSEPIVHLIAKSESEVRKRQGWKKANLEGMEVTCLSSENWWEHGTAILKKHHDAVHFFGGFWADRRYFPLMLYALWHGMEVVVMNESYSTENVGYMSDQHKLVGWVKVKLRPLLYRVAAFTLNAIARGSRPAVMAMSNRAVRQFLQAGFRDDQVFPFGYFIPTVADVGEELPRRVGMIRLVFLGSLLQRKGLDVLIEAVSNCHLRGANVIVDVYGPGESDRVPLSSDCVIYKGTIPFGEAQATIAQYDVLVLPSRHDGWGVVVNEALLQGIPVVASENVGAACLVEASGAGAVFRNEDVAGLQKIIQRIADDPTVLRVWRDKASKVKTLIEPEVAAKYMHDVVKFYFHREGDRPRLRCCESEERLGYL